MRIFMYITSCYDLNIVNCSIFSKTFRFHKTYYISGNGVDRRGQRGADAPMIKKLLFEERSNRQ